MTAPHQNLLGTSGAVDTGEETDPNFNQTVLLLHGDGTNGGQNNTFVDSSSSGHSITRIGNATQGTFSPFSLEDGYWSVYGDSADTDFVTYPNSSFASIGTGNFTIEFFVFQTLSTTDNAFRPFFGASNGGGSNSKFNIHDTGNGNLTLERNGGNVMATGDVRSQLTNQWGHVALVREGTGTNQTHIYVNGSKEATGTFGDNLGDVTTALYIARNPEGYSTSLSAYISNFKITSSALYSGSSFTVSTSPLTLTSQGSSSGDVKLLTHQSNRFLDNSSTGYAPTTVNTPKVQPFSPFAPSRSYSKNAVGGSAFFDGSGDYLTIPDSSEFHLGSGDFTIETWLYITNSNSVGAGWINQWAASNLSFYFGTSTTNQFIFGYSSNGSSFLTAASGHIITNNLHQWTHFAVCRSGNNLRLFVNGTQVGSTTDFTGVTLHDSTASIVVGYNATGTSSWYLNGFMLGARILKSALYSSGSFTLPTVPPTSNSDTKLLMNFTNAEIIDNTMKSNLETVDNAQIDTSVKKFGTGSIQFDGTNDKLVIPHQEIHQLGTGEFTVELFVYFTSTDQRQGFFGNDQGWYFQIYDGELEFALSVSAVIERSFSHSINQWYHLAATRDSSNDIRLFIDGTQQGAVVNSTADLRHASNDFHIGNIGPATSRLFKGGYMDEIRITKGVARYTGSSFTVPTKAFANK
jgi:hypothetical protein